MIYVLLYLGVLVAASYCAFSTWGTVRAYLSRYQGQHRAAPGDQPMKTWCPTRPMRVIR